ncbi:MAG: Ig-like domain-containing protein, partial [Mesotoga sp.]|nr:Ig-like domain-containing protein [Mesotoga sp.]
MKKTLFTVFLSLVILTMVATQGCFLFRVVKLDLQIDSLTLFVSEAEVIQLKVNPADAELKFTSAATSIAVVSDAGEVTGVSPGETRITIEASKDRYRGVSKTVDVTVLPVPEHEVTFNVSDSQGAVEGANVTFNGETKATDAQGKATFTGVLAGN